MSVSVAKASIECPKPACSRKFQISMKYALSASDLASQPPTLVKQPSLAQPATKKPITTAKQVQQVKTKTTQGNAAKLVTPNVSLSGSSSHPSQLRSMHVGTVCCPFCCASVQIKITDAEFSAVPIVPSRTPSPPTPSIQTESNPRFAESKPSLLSLPSPPFLSSVPSVARKVPVSSKTLLSPTREEKQVEPSPVIQPGDFYNGRTVLIVDKNDYSFSQQDKQKLVLVKNVIHTNTNEYKGISGRWSKFKSRSTWSQLTGVLLLGEFWEQPQLTKDVSDPVWNIEHNDQHSIALFRKKVWPANKYKVIMGSSLWKIVDTGVTQLREMISLISSEIKPNQASNLISHLEHQVLKPMQDLINQARSLHIDQWVIWREAETRVVLLDDYAEDVVFVWACWRSAFHIAHMVADKFSQNLNGVAGRVVMAFENLDSIELLYTGILAFADAADIWLYGSKVNGSGDLPFGKFDVQKDEEWKKYIKQGVLLDVMLPHRRSPDLKFGNWGPEVHPTFTSKINERLRKVTSASIIFQERNESDNTIRVSASKLLKTANLPLKQWVQFDKATSLRVSICLSGDAVVARSNVLSKFTSGQRPDSTPRLLKLYDESKALSLPETIMQIISYSFDHAIDFRIWWAATLSVLALASTSTSGRDSIKLCFGLTGTKRNVFFCGRSDAIKKEGNEVFIEMHQVNTHQVGWICPSDCSFCSGLYGGACEDGILKSKAYRVFFISAGSAECLRRIATVVTNASLPCSEEKELVWLG